MSVKECVKEAIKAFMDDEDMGGMHSVVCDTLFELQEEDMAMELNLPIADPKN
jgi:hypothetical protein